MPNKNQKEIALVGLSSVGQGVFLSPVQLQKLFFIIDRELGPIIGGKRFNFAPYDYGPFDKELYETFDALALEGFVQVNHVSGYNSYALTSAGFQEGQKLLNRFPHATRDFISDTANWIRSLTFQELVAAIYKKYPDMQSKSIFNP